MSSGSWDSFFRTVLGSGSSDRAEDNFTLATFDDSAEEVGNVFASRGTFFSVTVSPQIKKSFSTECIVFAEFPFYKWNLADWLNKEARKPWEKQSVMRQILYAVSHLHDHDIVHNVSPFIYNVLSWCFVCCYVHGCSYTENQAIECVRAR